MNDEALLDSGDRARLLSTLGWWIDAGVDVLVDAAPRDWFEASAPSSAATPPAAASIAELRAAVEAFAGCPLRTSGVNTVFADGNPAADLMLIGEAPGAREDRVGLPFVGPAGQLLDRMLAAIGRDRTTSYITNVAFWRPPGNRTPTPEEVETCLPFVHRHIALVKPKVVVALGAVATRALTGDATGIMRMRGQWRTLIVEGAEYPLLPMLHPAFLLRQPDAKRLAWTDLLAVKARLDAD